MRPALRALAASQSGVFTRRQCVQAGYSETELRTCTAVRGPWVTVRRGVYAERELWDSLTGYDEQARLRDLAVHLSMATDHVMSHDSAARALRLPMLTPRFELSHVTRQGVGGSRTERGVKHHLTRLELDPVLGGGLPTTGLARTAVDLAREHGLETGVVACDRALALRVPRVELETELLCMWCWPGVRTAREAVHLADAGAETPGESLTRLLLLELGLGPVQTQFPVRIGNRVAWTDMVVGCHAVEFDGHGKLRPVERGGLAVRPVEDVLWDERQRQVAVCGEGLGMSRVSWPDLFGAQRRRTGERLLREYAVTVARFGTVLPAHLAESATRIRREQPRRFRVA